MKCFVGTYKTVHYKKCLSGAHNPEQATPILGLCHGIFTDWFIFRSLFTGKFKESSSPRNMIHRAGKKEAFCWSSGGHSFRIKIRQSSLTTLSFTARWTRNHPCLFDFRLIFYYTFFWATRAFKIFNWNDNRIIRGIRRFTLTTSVRHFGYKYEC